VRGEVIGSGVERRAKRCHAEGEDISLEERTVKDIARKWKRKERERERERETEREREREREREGQGATRRMLRRERGASGIIVISR